ncbi:MAG: adenylate/guanylate cyclase domain-containing protein [Elusimicrobia bacterium]|nr:adenylate/guanylate cyclase domain-containing protein [Elusimicrobiota bacterium]
MNTGDILKEVDEILSSKWAIREGRKVPEASDIQLGNDAITLAGTVLYADMSDSTELVNGYKPWFAAEIYKSYLVGACRIIRANGGEITAFDGDRVMGVFVGDQKNTSAAKAALKINFIVRKINDAIKAKFPTTSFILRQKIGIDTSDLFVVRTGIRNSNDLVWVGRAANFAAKMCSINEAGFPTFITEQVFNKLADETKFSGNPRRAMWEKQIWQEFGIVIYRSNWWWKP